MTALQFRVGSDSIGLAFVRENMAAARGPLTDEAFRRRMVAHVEAL